MLNITNVYVKLNEDDTNEYLLAEASIILNNSFCINGIELLKNSRDEYYIRFAINQKHKTIAHPVTEDCRKIIENEIISKYTFIKEKNSKWKNF